METLIVGAGAMGRWYARTCAGDEVAFADADRGTAEAAADELGGRAVALDGEEAFDVVCVAVPISAAPEVIREQAPRAQDAVVDVTGVMAPAVAAMREAAPDRERMSLHPLFAPEREPGTVAVVLDSQGPATGRIRGKLVASGNRVVETDPGTHDRAMETVQARAHAALLAFALAAEPVPEVFATPVLEGLAELVEAVTGGDPRVYSEIQAAFDGAEDVAEAAALVAEAAGDHGDFATLYAEADPVIEGSDDPSDGHARDGPGANRPGEPGDGS